MAGIMKFFKPTDGGGGSAKKAEQLTVGTTAREVFSPVGNIKGAQRAAARPAPENDSDVEIVGEEASAGLKRKRKDTGRTTSGHRAATGNCAGVATAAQQPGQQNATSSFNAVQPCEAVAADVEMSPEAGANLAPEASSPGADAGTLLGASEAAAAASDQEQLLSPDLAAHQPTAKRQRVPEPSDQQRPSTEVNADHNSLDAPVAERAAPDGADGASGPSAMTPQPANGALPRQPDNADQAELLQQPDPQQQQHHDQDEGDPPSASQQQQTVAADVDAAAAPATGGGGAGGAAANGGTGAKSGGAGPATLPPDMALSATLESLRREQAGLEAALETEMLLPETDSDLSAVAAASEGGRLASMPTPAQLCAWLEGRTGPLSALVSCLEPLLPPGAGADPTALRTSLVDLAQRKCYSEKEAPLDGAAASEDATPGRLWVWEVREPRKHLQGDSKDTAARKLAEAMRKRRKELRERLVAVGSALEALAAHQALTQPPAHAAAGSAVKGPSAAARRTAESRAAKAWNRLGRLADLEAVEAVYRTTSEGLMAGSAGSSARKERARKAEKEKEREEKAREKEEKAREKEEKARQREEEARAKEAKKAQEDEAKRRAKEIAAANKAGYHSKQELQKSRNIMHSFFKRSATPAQQQDKPGPAAAAAGGQAGGEGDAGTSSAADGGGAAAASGLASSQQPQLRDPAAAAPSGGRGCSQPAGATPARERPVPTTMFDFSKVACRLPDRAVVEALDSAASRLPLPAEQLAEELRANHGRWRQQRAARRRMIGVPPTWARRPRAPTDLRTLAAQYYGDVAALGLAPEGLRTWRRKLIAFPRKESARPPYYGSFSRNSTCVTGRRPFGRDSSLDYEVASDEEWEEEPEGESLSDSGDEADSQAGGGPGEGGDDEDDGFIVGDDHLSDDEGAQLSGDPDDPMHVDGAPAKGKGAAAAAATTTTATRFMDPRLQQLESAIDRVRTNNRPILLVRPLPTAAAAAEGADVDMTEPAAAVAGLHCRLRAEPRPGLNTGLDPGLLGALRPVVHTRCGEPGVPLAALAPPLELDVYSAYAAAAAGAAAQGPAAAGGCGNFGSGAEDGPAAAATLATGGTPGGRDTRNPAALFAAGGGGAAAVAPVAPGSARAPGSGARGRPHGPGLPAATLTALAEFMSRCGDQRMEKIVEGFLATLPPNIKPPAKTKLRDAIKRLGAWSASTKRWHLQGGSVEAAVEHALAAAAAAAAAATAAAAAAAQMGTPLAAAAAVAAAASAGRGLVAAGGAMSTPTPGPALPPGLPAPTPAPHLGPLPTPLPTPSTAPGGRPLLPAPASTPLDGAAAAPGTSGAAHRPMGHQVVLPQHLLQALARLAPEATAAATPPPAAVVDADRYGSALTSASVMAAPATRQAVPAATPIVPPSLPLVQQQQRPAHHQGNGHGGGAEAEAGRGEAMDCDELLPAAQQQQHLLSGPGAGNQADGALLGGSGAVVAPSLPLAAPAAEPGQGENGSEGEAGRAAGTAAGGEAASDAVQTLPRPMPPPLPPLSELAILGSGHPFWAALSSWIMGGGGAAARSRRHGPSWADVSAALAVFVAGELEPRLSWMPLDLVRVLVAVCQHRSASHLRSGAFKALANVAAALAASAAPAAGAGAGAGTTPGGGALPRRRRGARCGADAEAPSTTGREGSPDGGDGAGPSSPSAPQRLRPTGQPSRCSPQPVSLRALVALPGLMEALRRGLCGADPDSETDKAARSAARVIAAIAGIGIASPPTASRPTHAEPHAPEPGNAADAAAAASPRPQPPQPAAAPGPALAPDVGAAAAAFRLRAVCDRDLHGALRDATARGPGPDAPGARVVFHAHMLLALQRLARDPAAAARLLAPKTRLAREAAAAADGKPPPPPPSADLESKWGAQLVEKLVAGGRGMTHDGCRKGMVNTAAALLDLPALRRVLPPGGEEGGIGSGSPPAEDGGATGEQAPGRGGSGGWSSVLSGNDPRAQLPAAVLTLLVSELQHVAGGAGGGSCDGGSGSSHRRRAAARNDGGAGGGAADEDGGAGEDGTPPPAAPAPLSKCARARVAVALQLAERALRHLGRPGSRLQLRQADTKAAVAELLEALRDSGEVLAATYEPQLQALYTGVGSLAEELAA